MSVLIDYVLHFLYGGLYEKKKADVVFDINNEYTKQTNYIKATMYKIYFMSIITLICWQIIYSIINEINLYDIPFQVLFAIIYVFGFLYVRTTHFQIKIKSHSELFYWTICSIIFTVIITSIQFGFFISNYMKISVYHNIYDNLDLGEFFVISVLFFAEKIFGYLAFFVNVSVIIVNLKHDTCNITEYLNEFRNIMTIQQLNIASVIKECTKIKENHNITIKKFNIIFSVTTIVGLIGIYCFINEIKKNDIYVNTIMNIIIFIIIEFLYFYSIRSIKKCITRLQEELFTEKIILKYIVNHTDHNGAIEVTNEISLKKIDNMILYNIILTGSNQQSLQWITLRDVIQNGWKTFEIFGFAIDDETIIKKFTGLLSTFLIALKISDTIPF